MLQRSNREIESSASNGSNASAFNPENPGVGVNTRFRGLPEPGAASPYECQLVNFEKAIEEIKSPNTLHR